MKAPNMKLSLVSCGSLLFVLSLLGCSSDEAKAPAMPPVAAADAGGPVVTPKRTFVERSLLTTAPDNLFLDPEMMLSDEEVGTSGFLVMAGNDVTRTAVRSLTTPVGGVRRAALLVAPRATDATSSEVVMVTSFAGVVGPFEVSVWLARTTVKGEPSDTPLAASALLSKEMTLGGPGSGDATGVALVSDETSRVTIDGYAWTKYVARVNDDTFERGGQFLISTGEKGGGVLVLAPEARASKAADRHYAPLALGERRAVRHVERAAITRLRALPVRLARPPVPRPLAAR